MAINDNIIIMLRAVINDLDSASYTDPRLDQLVAVAAQFVNQDLDGDYTINLSDPTITPDPYANSDDAFVNLTVLKAACLVDQGTFRTKAAVAGLMAKAGPATIQTLQHLDGFKELLSEGPCGAYRTALTDYKLGAGSIAQIILGPFVNDDFDPCNLQSYPDTERYVR